MADTTKSFATTRSFMEISYAMRTVMASISFVASTTIAFVILKMPHGLSSSYRRIILCLSIADVIQSLSIILGPFAVPQDTPDSIWAIGNTASCTTQGFLLNIASVATPMYTFGLSIYFLLRVKYGMSREDFAAVVEWKWHTVTLLWNLVGNSYILFTKSINASRAGSLCHIDGLPLLCDVDPEKYGECIRGENALQIKSIVIYVPILVCFLSMGTSLGMLTWHVFAQESKKKHSQEATLHKNDDKMHTSSGTNQISNNAGSLENPLSMARTYRKEMLTQSCLYMFGHLFTYAFLLINQFFYISGRPYPDWSHMAISLTWPLGGFINILIYTRPKIAILRIRQPQLSWTKAFRTIILAGAEVPDESPDFPSSNVLLEPPPLRQHRNTDDNNDIGTPVLGGEEGGEVDAMNSSTGGKETEQECLGERQATRKKNMIPSSFLDRSQFSKNIEHSSSPPSSLHPRYLWSEENMNHSQPGEHRAQGTEVQWPKEQNKKRYKYYLPQA